MNEKPDPFAHHPELRGKIIDPLQSFFRTFNAEEFMKHKPELAEMAMQLHSDAVRESSRMAALIDYRDSDLWVFAYGSLMWDPAFHFVDVRRAHVRDYARHFILKDTFGARGSRDVPGLMAALDKGSGCNGLVYRIERDEVDVETEILWRREMVGAGYLPTFVEAEISGGPVMALTFVADYDAEIIAPNLTRAEQVEYIATGKGFLGTSLEYLTNIANHFDALGIIDEDITALLAETEAYIQSGATP